MREKSRSADKPLKNQTSIKKRKDIHQAAMADIVMHDVERERNERKG